MYDYSYSLHTIASVLRKGDFVSIPLASWDTFRDQIVQKAVESAHSYFGNINPVEIIHLKKKDAYRISKLEDDLVVRKLAENIRRHSRSRASNRAFITQNLCKVLSEGVPYHVYKIDIKSFYESFDTSKVLEKVQKIPNLAPIHIKHLQIILDGFHKLGGRGLPRGMSISAVLSDYTMSDFDFELSSNKHVFFYSRYVDDIVIVTDGTENRKNFMMSTRKALPKGLVLNDKKCEYYELNNPVIKKKNASTTRQLNFQLDYLGYRYSINEPCKSDFSNNLPKYDGFRYIDIDIAPLKVKKIKTRIIRSFIDYSKNKDTRLLIDRIKYLTSNFSIFDRNTGQKRISGIYHNYPLIDDNSPNLNGLDAFLVNTILSKKGRLFSTTHTLINGMLRRKLLSHQFKKGFSTKRFIYFHATRISDIQRCWKNE